MMAPLPSSGSPERVDHAAEQPLADRHLEKLAGGADFVAFLELGVIADDDGADFGFFQVQRDPGDALSEVEHFIEHCVGQTFHLATPSPISRMTPTFCLAVAALAPSI